MVPWHLRSAKVFLHLLPTVSGASKENKDKSRQQEIYRLHERLRRVNAKYKNDLVEERKKREEKEEEMRELEKEISRSKETFQDREKEKEKVKEMHYKELRSARDSRA